MDLDDTAVGDSVDCLYDQEGLRSRWDYACSKSPDTDGLATAGRGSGMLVVEEG